MYKIFEKWGCGNPQVWSGMPSPSDEHCPGQVQRGRRGVHCAQSLKVPNLLAITLVSSDSQAPGRLKKFPSILHLYLLGFLV